MDREVWAREYGRLCTAYGKTPSTEQARVYYAALEHLQGVCVTEAVTEAVRESRGWPSAADLAERSRQIRRERYSAPAGACDVCHGETWTIHECAGVSAPDSVTRPSPVSRHEFCGRTYVHEGHDFARRCYQCWQRMDGAA